MGTAEQRESSTGNIQAAVVVSELVAVDVGLVVGVVMGVVDTPHVN